MQGSHNKEMQNVRGCLNNEVPYSSSWSSEFRVQVVL
jgi:hypothetical protein